MLDSQRNLKIGIVDIETSDLDAYFGYIICACIKNYKGSILTYRIDNYENEKEMLRSLVKDLNTYDLLVGWFSSAFDFPFINTRCLIYHIKPPIKKYRRDLCFVSRGNLRLPNNKLRTVTQALEGKTLKTFTTPKIKIAAIRNETWALNFFVNHCRKDVIDTEKDYNRLMPLLSEKLKKGG